MKRYALALAVAPFVMATAHAETIKARAEADYGKCHAGSPDEGTWHQRDLPHNIQLSDKCGSLGLHFETPLRDVGFAVRYVNLGQYAVHAIANNDPEDKADLRGTVSTDHMRAECQTRRPGSYPLNFDCHYRWNGSGTIYGALFAATWHPIHIGDLTLGGEAGYYVYRATWNMVIQPVNSNEWQYDYRQKTGWSRSPEFGVSAYYKNLYIAARWYMVPDGAQITPGYRAPVQQVTAGISIPFSF